MTYSASAVMQVFVDILRKHSFTSLSYVEKIFTLFDKDCDGYLDKSEFNSLLINVIAHNGKPGKILPSEEQEIFSLLDDDKIFNPVSALLVIDVQNDFIDGTLSLKNCPSNHDGSEVVPVINNILENTSFDVVVYTFDWHPPNHLSFVENVNLRSLDSSSQVSAEKAQVLDKIVYAGPPKQEQILWPKHCVQNSWGSELHKDLKVIEGAVFSYKGTNPEVDSYSAFWDNGKLGQTDLALELAKRKITDVYCCGLASDVCVAATAAHSMEHGFRTTVIEDACRGVSEDDIILTKKRLEDNGAIYVTSDEVNDLVRSVDRRSALALRAARNVSEGIKMARALLKIDGKD
ncbi:nicotinamidase-like isoform X2 [Tubulanus polymorphus]|uniref:nicotinamidase-like isoform X2 n=1 Tax=Tubulanus polymorphus TaxID=672921 RepID=UPI003DA6768F